MARFITFEGIEGSGKTTQIQMLSNWLEERGVEHLLTREPGGTPIGDKIRRIVLDPAHGGITASCELLLYTAARAQHIEQVIRPALEDGRLVLCDRFKDATIAYQGFGRGLPLDLVLGLHEFDVLSLKPDLTLLFDIDARLALGRARQRDTAKASDQNRFELEGVDFHQRVRTGYLEIAGSEPDRFLVIDARGSVAEVHQRVVSEVQRYLETRGAPA